jgi:hypothetical protein
MYKNNFVMFFFSGGSRGKRKSFFHSKGDIEKVSVLGDGGIEGEGVEKSAEGIRENEDFSVSSSQEFN